MSKSKQWIDKTSCNESVVGMIKDAMGQERDIMNKLRGPLDSKKREHYSKVLRRIRQEISRLKKRG